MSSVRPTDSHRAVPAANPASPAAPAANRVTTDRPSTFDGTAAPSPSAPAPHLTLPTLPLDGPAVPPVGPFDPNHPSRGHGGKPISAVVTPDLAIPDNQVVTSTLVIEEEYEVDQVKVNLDIGHSYRGDLVVTLTSPSGKSVVLSDRAGGSADDLKGPIDLGHAFAGEKTQGAWTLTVEDRARLDTGTLRTWGLEIDTISRPEPAKSVPMPVVGLGEVKDRYTAEVHGRDGVVYTTTWGRRQQQGNTINVWDSRGEIPALAGTVTIPGAGTIGDVQVSDDGKTLLACTDRGQIFTYDLSDPLTPKLLGEYSSANTRPEVHTAELARVDGKLYAFLSCIYSNPPKLVTMDLSDPANPREVHSMATGRPYQHDVWVKDGILYAAGWDEGMTIWDLGGAGKGGSPENPVKVSTIATKNGNVHNIATYTDAESGKTFAFIGEEVPGSIGKSSSGDIHVVDITDLENPREVAFFHVDGAGTHNFALDAEKGILYAAYYNGGVRALDIRGDLSQEGERAPDGRIDLAKSNREVGHALADRPGSNYVWGVHLMDGYLYASDMLNGVFKIDPSVLVQRPRD